MPKNLHIAVGVICSIFKFHIHLNKVIKKKSNIDLSEWLGNLFVISKGVNTIQYRYTNVISLETNILSMRRFKLL